MTADLQLNDPQTLYRRWEDSQWSPFAVDLSRDRDQWPTMGGAERDQAAELGGDALLGDHQERMWRASSTCWVARNVASSSEL